MRQSVVAGAFYPDDSRELNALLDDYFSEADSRYKAISGVAPHAGYQYSGRTAAHTYANLSPAKTIVVIGPDHTGASLGATCIYPRGSWSTPLGEIKIDERTAQALQEIGELNASAHNTEHSIEVQLPFIQKKFPDAMIVPVMMGNQDEDIAVELGKALAEHECVVVASSDFSHYVPVQKAKEDDAAAIALLERLDVKRFYEKVIELQLSACGVGPIAAAATFAKQKGAKKGVLVNYSTSADVTGEDECVGYASIVFV